MGETEVSHDLSFSTQDGRKFKRLEMEEQIRTKWRHWSIKKLRANREYGLQNKVAQDMTPGMLVHWLLDEMIRKGQIDGDVLGVSVSNYNDPNEKAQLLQRLTALIQAGQALKPKTGEGLDMTMQMPPPPPPPAPPGPPNGQPWAPPPNYPPPPPAAAAPSPYPPQPYPGAPPAPPPGFGAPGAAYPPAPMASAPPPPPPVPGYGPPPGAPPPPPGPPQFQQQQPQFAAPPAGFPPPPAPAAAPPEGAGRRKRQSAPQQPPAPAAPVPGVPMPMPGAQPPMPPTWGAPPQQQQPPQNYPPQGQTNEFAELKTLIAAQAQEIHTLSRMITMVASMVVLGNRAAYQAQAPQGADGWSIEQRLSELGGPIPQ